MTSLPTPAVLAAGIGGLLWTIKALVIMARGGSFDPLESVFFIGGLLAIVLAAALISFHLARRFGLVVRVVATLAGVVAFFAATMLFEAIGKGLLGGPYDGGNVGIEEEGGILLAGLAWLALGAVNVLRRRGAHQAAVPSRV